MIMNSLFVMFGGTKHYAYENTAPLFTSIHTFARDRTHRLHLRIEKRSGVSPGERLFLPAEMQGEHYRCYGNRRETERIAFVRV